MAPDHRPSSPLQAALARVDLGRVHAQIVAYAISRLRSRDAGEELAQRVLVEAIDPDGRPWDPEREPELARHLIGRVNSAILNDYKKARGRSDPRAHDAVERQMDQPSSPSGSRYPLLTDLGAAPLRQGRISRRSIT